MVPAAWAVSVVTAARSAPIAISSGLFLIVICAPRLPEPGPQAIALFLISLWTQALVVFAVSLYLFSQGNWLVGGITLLLAIYLVFAGTVSDKQVSEAFAIARIRSPQMTTRLGKFIQFKQSPRWALTIMLFVIAFILGGYALGKLIDTAVWVFGHFIVP